MPKIVPLFVLVNNTVGGAEDEEVAAVGPARNRCTLMEGYVRHGVAHLRPMENVVNVAHHSMCLYRNPHPKWRCAARVAPQHKECRSVRKERRVMLYQYFGRLFLDEFRFAEGRMTPLALAGNAGRVGRVRDVMFVRYQEESRRNVFLRIPGRDYPQVLLNIRTCTCRGVWEEARAMRQPRLGDGRRRRRLDLLGLRRGC